jgi:hypothetical protein
MALIHGYIYLTVPTPPPEKRWLYRFKRPLGIMLSVVGHVGLFSYLAYRGIVAPLTDMRIVDEAYNEVHWVEVTRRARPLKYPAQLMPAWRVPLPLAEAAAEKPPVKNSPQRSAEDAADDSPPADPAANEAANGENSTADADAATADTTTPPTPTEPPRFGVVNTRPLKEIVSKVYGFYKRGELDIDNIVFKLVMRFDVTPIGELVGVEVVQSSGLDYIDSSALNIAAALSESHALMPLSTLKNNLATLEVTRDNTSLKVIGDAVNSAVASELSTNFQQQLAGVRLLLKFNNPDAAAMLNFLQISNEGTRLIANLNMPRQEASNLMRRNFTKFLPDNDKPAADPTSPIQTEDKPPSNPDQ